MKRFKKLTNYELAELWGKIKVLCWNMENTVNRQDTTEFYIVLDQLQELKTKMQNHYVAVDLDKAK